MAWYDLQRFWAGHLPEGALQIGSAFESYEESADGVIVHLKVHPTAAASFFCMRAVATYAIGSMHSWLHQHAAGNKPDPSVKGVGG